MARDIMLTARITADEDEFLRGLGGGNRSQGLKTLLSRGMGTPVAPPAPVKVHTPQRAAPAPAAETRHFPAGTPVKRFIGKR